MRAIFGAVGLLVVLVLVGVLTVQALRKSAPAAAPTSAGASAASPREAAQALQRQVQGEVGRALEAGAAARDDEAGK